MDRGGGSVAPARPTAEVMAERREDTRTYWQNYLGFRADLESERDDALRRVRQQGTYGQLSPAQTAASSDAISRDFESRLEELRQGPTYQLLAEEFAAQQDFARAEDERAMQQYGTYEYREASRGVYEGGEGGMGYEGPTEAGWYQLMPQVGGGDEDIAGPNWQRIQGEPPPRPEPTVFQGSMEDYYGEQFGSDVRPNTGGVGGDSTALRARAAGGAGAGRVVGVGRVYPTY